jgi:hypothetical protein
MARATTSEFPLFFIVGEVEPDLVAMSSLEQCRH